MAKSQKEAIKRELVDRATGKGKEPTWEGEPTQLQLVQVLNFYSANSEPEKLKQYAIKWAQKHAPDKVELIQAQPDWKFQTYGALMRIDSRGLKLSKVHLEEIQSFVNGLEMPVVENLNKPKRKKKTSMNTNENANYRNFCDALDGAIAAGKFEAPKFELDKNHTVSGVIDACERELASMKEDPTIYPEHMSKWFRSVIKIMTPGLEPANSPVIEPRVVKRAKVQVDPATVPNPNPKKVKEPAAPKAKKEPAAPAPDLAADHILNGKKLAFLFDTRYGRLTRMVASNKSGFSVKGKTISGIDEKKSKVALLKNYGKAMEQGASTAEELEAWMGKCVKKGNPIAVGGRLSDAILILSAA